MTQPATQFEDAYLESYNARPGEPESVHREYATEKAWRRPRLTIAEHDQEVAAVRLRADQEREAKRRKPPPSLPRRETTDGHGDGEPA